MPGGGGNAGGYVGAAWGYAYDSETERYYLQSRYYDPEMFDAAGRIWTAFPVKR